MRAGWIIGLLGVGILVVIGATGLPRASSNGISAWSGNPAINSGQYCSTCHTGGIVPTVTIAGPSSVETGTLNTYTLTIEGGQERAGGLDVSASAGTMSVNPGDGGTHLDTGEITHDAPRNVNAARDVVFTFDWIAPAQAGTAFLYGAGNSVNLGQTSDGDAAATDVFQITVTAAAGGPGETSGEFLAPLLVTGHDPITGAMDLSYGNPCDTTDHNIYYGDLDQVASLAWSGEQCGIGVSESYAGFDPGAGSYFFVIVANNGTDDGSYGKDLDGAGAQDERLPFAGNACSTIQNLADRCDP